ncbi:MAG: hypothetical protein JW845_09355 [Dehalococcoidales bacterium]|nr:hypothetical protein [Dehalococcoidales bacterium]
MLSELKAIFDVVEKLLEKRKVSQEQKIRDKVVIAIYILGDNGKKAVSSDELEAKGGFPKKQIHQSIDLAKSEGWIISASNHKGMAWALTPNAMYYVEGLLENK